MKNDGAQVDGEEGSDFGDFQGQRLLSSKPSMSPTPPPHEEMAAIPQIPPPGSGRKRGRTPVASSSNGGRQEKGRKKAKSSWFVLQLSLC
jgi:hypothetical protein